MRDYRNCISHDRAASHREEDLEWGRGLKKPHDSQHCKWCESHRATSRRGMAWSFSLSPLTKKEERCTSRKHQWCLSRPLPYGDYKVAPDRYDINIFQRKYWISKELRGLINLATLFGGSLLTESDYRFMRVTIFKYLGNSSSKLTGLQKSLLACMHYVQRHRVPLKVANSHAL
jgi:hypothetical protein